MAPLGVPQRPGTCPVPVEGQPAAARGWHRVRTGRRGEDLGRLVAVTDDARSQLVHRALSDSPPDTAAGVRHAIALFRARDTSAERKRSAIFNLARILEERRALIKEHLGKDEGALFEIANRFDLRHRRADQRGEYDEAFLDWIFWWYLATVELTNRLIASRTPA